MPKIFSLISSLYEFAFKCVLLISAISTLIILAPDLSPNMKFEPYTFGPGIKLEPNGLLDAAESIFHGQLADGGAESFVFDNSSGSTITYGLSLSGWVLKVHDSGAVERLWKVQNSKGVQGRPIGLQKSPNSDGVLIMADAHLGIVQYNVHSGEGKVLLELEAEIGGRELKFPNALDISRDGVIYFSDSSSIWGAQKIQNEMIGEPSGRLIRFDPKNGNATVLKDRIHFANGVALSEDEDFVLVSELMGYRVHKYHLKGDKTGSSEIFLDHLPGTPDNIRSNGKGGFFIMMVMGREGRSKVFEWIGGYPTLRKLILRTQELLFDAKSFGNSFGINLDWLIDPFKYHVLGFVDITRASEGSIAIEVDENGVILRNFQKKYSTISGLSEIAYGETYTYFGAPFTNHIWRIKTEFLNP